MKKINLPQHIVDAIAKAPRGVVPPGIGIAKSISDTDNW